MGGYSRSLWWPPFGGPSDACWSCARLPGLCLGSGLSVTFPCPTHTAHYRLLYTSHAHVSHRRSTGWMAGVDYLAPMGLLRPRALLTCVCDATTRAVHLAMRFPRCRRSGRFGRFHIHFGSRAQATYKHLATTGPGAQGRPAFRLRHTHNNTTKPQTCGIRRHTSPEPTDRPPRLEETATRACLNLF